MQIAAANLKMFITIFIGPNYQKRLVIHIPEDFNRPVSIVADCEVIGAGFANLYGLVAGSIFGFNKNESVTRREYAKIHVCHPRRT